MPPTLLLLNNGSSNENNNNQTNMVCYDKSKRRTHPHPLERTSYTSSGRSWRADEVVTSRGGINGRASLAESGWARVLGRQETKESLPLSERRKGNRPLLFSLLLTPNPRKKRGPNPPKHQ